MLKVFTLLIFWCHIDLWWQLGWAGTHKWTQQWSMYIKCLLTTYYGTGVCNGSLQVLLDRTYVGDKGLMLVLAMCVCARAHVCVCVCVCV